MYPDVPDHALFDGLPGLIAGGLASSIGLVLTVGLFNQPLEPVLLRLVPGWGAGRPPAGMVGGLPAPRQALALLSTPARVRGKGALAPLPRALPRAARPAAV